MKIAITVIYVATEITISVLKSVSFFKRAPLPAHALWICLYFSDLWLRKFNNFQIEKHPCHCKNKLKVLLSTKKQCILSSILTYFWHVRMNEMTQNKEIFRKTIIERQLQLYLDHYTTKIILVQNALFSMIRKEHITLKNIYILSSINFKLRGFIYRIPIC